MGNTYGMLMMMIKNMAILQVFTKKIIWNMS